MLTDTELDRIAKAHVAGRHSAEFVPVRLFALEEPSGVYFGVSDLRVDLGDVVPGDPGFFVHRDNGRIRQFDLGDFISPLGKPPGDSADQRLVQAVRSAMSRQERKPQ